MAGNQTKRLPELFPRASFVEVTDEHINHNHSPCKYLARTTNKVPTKVWLVASLACLVICGSVVGITAWVSAVRTSDDTPKHTDDRMGQQRAIQESLYSQQIAKRYPFRRLPDNDDKRMEDFAKELNNRNSTGAVRHDRKMYKTKGSDHPAPSASSTDELSNKMERMLYEEALKKHLAASIPSSDVKQSQIPPEAIFGTQISSPDNMEGQTTTHQNHVPREGSDSGRVWSHPDDQKDAPNYIPNNGYEEYYKSQSVGSSEESFYDPDGFFYSENDAQDYYYNYDENSWGSFLLEKIQQLHNWITSDIPGPGVPELSKGDKEAPIPQVLEALNFSIISGDSTILLTRLKNMYYKHNDTTTIDVDQTRKDLTNSSSIMSLGLLALDILLLRNIQLMAWDDQETANNEVMSDPEVFALNALFMEPVKVKAFYEELKLTQLRNWADDSVESKSQDITPLVEDDSLTAGFYTNTNIFRDLVEFVMSATRAAVHLGKAYRIAKDKETKNQMKADRIGVNETTPIARDNSLAVSSSASKKTVSEVDCIWTLYCRNLERTAKIGGPYGFLAKLNSLGLRLLIGNVSLDRAIDTLLEETLNGPRSLHCDKLFPKCSSLNAAKIVLESIIKN